MVLVGPRRRLRGSDGAALLLRLDFFTPEDEVAGATTGDGGFDGCTVDTGSKSESLASSSVPEDGDSEGVDRAADFREADSGGDRGDVGFRRVDDRNIRTGGDAIAAVTKDRGIVVAP